MKKVILFHLIFLMSAIDTCAQKIENSENFMLTGIDSVSYVQFMSGPESYKDTLFAHVISKSDPDKKILSVPMYQEELYMASVEEIETSVLKNVQKVVKLEFEYMACCSDIVSCYYLLTKKGDWVPLPIHNWVICEWPSDVTAYEFSEKNTIRLVVKKYDYEAGEFKGQEEQKSYSWDGKVFQEIK